MISTCYRCSGLSPCVTYLPRVTSRFIPGIFILHGSVYLTDRELFVRAAQNGTPEDNGEGMRRPAIRIAQAMEARWTMRMFLVFCSISRMRSPKRPERGCGGAYRELQA